MNKCKKTPKLPFVYLNRSSHKVISKKKTSLPVKLTPWTELDPIISFLKQTPYFETQLIKYSSTKKRVYNPKGRNRSLSDLGCNIIHSTFTNRIENYTKLNFWKIILVSYRWKASSSKRSIKSSTFTLRNSKRTSQPKIKSLTPLLQK